MGVFDTIATALSGKPAPQPNAGVGKGAGPAGPPVPVPDSVKQARAAAYAKAAGIQNVMGAHADQIHPVKP